MTRLAVLLLALALAGCTTASIEFRPDPDKPPVMVVSPMLYGRGAIVTTYTWTGDEKKIESVVCTDATTDWSLARLFAFLGDVVAGTPFGGSQQRGASQMNDPSMVQGCSQLYGDPPADDAEEEEQKVTVRGEVVEEN